MRCTADSIFSCREGNESTAARIQEPARHPFQPIDFYVTMKTTLFSTFRFRVVALLLLMTGFVVADAFAQDQQRRQRGQRMSAEERVAVMMDEMKKGVGLTADQSAQIQPILEWQMQEMMALREEAQGDRQKMRSLMQELQAETEAQIFPLLTEEQVVKYKEFQANRGPQGRRQQGRRGLG